MYVGGISRIFFLTRNNLIALEKHSFTVITVKNNLKNQS